MICEVMTMKAFSTLVLFFAEVSTNSMPKEFANSCACVVWRVRSGV